MNKFLCIALLMFFVAGLYALNNMQIIQTLVGETPNSYFGFALTSLDFNGDGIDDLVVSNGGHKIYVYYGGTQFGFTPDLVRQHVNYDILVSAGDVNGDGFEDLLTVETYPDSVETNQAIMRFFYGGPNADLEPDYEIIIPNWGAAGLSIYPQECIGDTNNDGFDDIGCLWKRTAAGDSTELAIMLGGSFQMVSVVTDISSYPPCIISGLGDVNDDGFDDFMIGYAPENYPYFPRYRYIYFGGNGIDLLNRVLLMESNSTHMVAPGGWNIGDFNGDGFNDFTITEPIDTRSSLIKFKFGSQYLSSSTELVVTASEYLPSLIDYEGNCIAFGDFNGDGFSDVVTGNRNASFWDGIAGVWLGGANPNGYYDMAIYPPATSPYHQFGWAVTSGDYNNDGYCDVAISSPNSNGSSPTYPGYVYVYAGNAQLADTTVANDDQIIVPLTESITLSIFPNPFKSGRLNMNYTIDGKLPKNIQNATLVTYNIKGQIISKHSLKMKQVEKGKGSIISKKLKPGIYIIALIIDNQRTAATKFTIFD